MLPGELLSGLVRGEVRHVAGRRSSARQVLEVSPHGTDLQTQLNAILAFNQIWAQYIPTLNAASSPAQAADIYVTDFERAGLPAYGTREEAAAAVAQACGI